MMEVMRETPTDDELKPVIPEDVELLDFDFEHKSAVSGFLAGIQEDAEGL